MRTPIEIQTRFAKRETLSTFNSFYLVGIGGAGLSAVARMLLRQGFRVKGSDWSRSVVTDSLIELGAEVDIAEAPRRLAAGDAVVLTDAVDLDLSPEVKIAIQTGAGLYRRSQALGWLLRNHQVIAVTGTHGKTTTSGMIGHVLTEAGLDPTVVIGADLPDFPGGYRSGRGSIAVVEACEAYDSLHDIDPAQVVLTNLELDHVDFHPTWESLRDSVLRFVDRIPAGGQLFFSLQDKGSGEVATETVAQTSPFAAFEGKLSVPGAHNRQNAGAAFALCASLGVSMGQVTNALQSFQGADRRLQTIYDQEIAVIDDYAHHPTEIRASIQATRESFPGRRLLAVFQPHLYSRTAANLDEFASALTGADVVFLTDIYPAREDPMPGMSSLRIVEKIPGLPRYIPQRHLLPRVVARVLVTGDVVLTMGAGNISEFPPALIQEWEHRIELVEHPTRLNVAVLYAGDSPEREVSIHSGRAIYTALGRLGYHARLVDVSESLLSTGDLSQFVGANRPDVAILALHGENAEDGAVQGLLQLLHIPYNGSGIQASALAMDKDLTKRILTQAGLPVPKGIVVRRGDPIPDLPLPLVVKPNAQGSTVGLTFVRDQKDLEFAIQRALSYDSSALVEEMIEGIEISVPVMGERALPVVEIVPVSGSYDFAAKYTPGATEEICPARLTEVQTRIAQEQAVKAHKALGCRGITRTDMIVQGDRLVILETNNLPGMTATSLVPRSAEVAGISFDELVQGMVNDATSTL